MAWLWTDGDRPQPAAGCGIHLAMDCTGVLSICYCWVFVTHFFLFFSLFVFVSFSLRGRGNGVIGFNSVVVVYLKCVL